MLSNLGDAEASAKFVHELQRWICRITSRPIPCSFSSCRVKQ